jgi:hypothetical protein
MSKILTTLYIELPADFYGRDEARRRNFGK